MRSAANPSVAGASKPILTILPVCCARSASGSSRHVPATSVANVRRSIPESPVDERKPGHRTPAARAARDCGRAVSDPAAAAGRHRAVWQTGPCPRCFEPMTEVPVFRFDNSFARELPRFYVPLRPAVVPAPRLLFFNESLAEELGLDLGVARRRRQGRDLRRQHVARRRRAARPGLRGPPVRRILAAARRRPRAAARRGDRPARQSSRHRVQGLGPHAVLARRRRQGRRRADAARGADRRSHARARHPDDARARRRRDRRAGVSRDRCCPARC